MTAVNFVTLTRQTSVLKILLFMRRVLFIQLQLICDEVVLEKLAI